MKNKNMVGEFGTKESGYLLVPPSSKTQPNSPRPYQFAILLVITVVLLSVMTLSSQSFSLEIKQDKSSISFMVEGPQNTPFSLTILDFRQVNIFERTASTDSSGSYNLFIPVFEEGSYVAILRSGPVVEVKEFEIKNHLIESTTTTLSTLTTTFTIPFVTTDDYNETESLEYVRDSNLNKIKAKIRTFKRLPTQASNIRDVYVIPEDGPVKEIRFKNLNVSNEFEIGIDDAPEDMESPNGIGWSEVYAIDPSKLEFNSATVKAVAKGNALYKCRDWNFSEQRCYGTWEKMMKLNPGEEYSFELTAEDPGFGELNITKAEHLDENRIFVEDAYEYVKARDYTWIEIPSEHYIRATFEKNLTSGNDITIYARSNYTNSSVKVYEENGNETIADFGVINENKKYRVLLTNLTESQDTFDLKVVGGNVEFDWIVDPIIAFFNDTFTEASDTALTSHTPDDGTGWSLAAQSAVISATVIAARDILQFGNNANDYSLWTADDSPISSEYNVSVTVKAIDTRDDVAILLGRYVDTSNTYVVSLSGTATECHLKVVSGGDVTTLDTPGTGVSVNDVIEFEITNSTKNVYRNGALWMSSNNDDVTDIGRGGVGCGDFAGDGSEDCRPNWDLDDFIIKEFRPDTTPPVITVYDPQNTSYGSLPIPINVTTNEDVSWCGWNLDNSGSNTTMDNSSMTEWNGSVTSTTEETHQLYVYCNDTSGNMGVNSTIYFTYDLTPPTYSNVQQNPSSPVYGQDVQCNSTWNDLSSVDVVVFRSNYTGFWTNYTTSDPICDNESNIFYCNIPGEYPAGKVVGWNYWANDSLNHWNNTMTEQVFTIQKAPTEMNLLLNGTDGDENYEVGQIVNITAALNISDFNVEIWTNYTGITENVSNSPGSTPLTNLTDTSGFSPGDVFNITGYFPGNENYTDSGESHLLLISTDATDPNITDVSASPQSGGFGRTVTISANVTDNSDVDKVFANITLPDNTWEWYEMTNYTKDIYEYNYTPWQTGSYYYSIWANDTYGNSKEYDPYFYVNGTALMAAYTVKDTYGPNENVNLTPAQNWTSDNLESGVVKKEAGGIEYYYNESNGESTWNADANWQDKVVLNITPTGGNYLILASAELRGTDSANDIRARLLVDGSEYANTNTEPDETGASDWHTHFATHKVMDLNSSEHMLKIQYSKDAGGGTVGIKNARIAVMQLDDYEYNETEGQVTINSNTVWGTTVTRNFTVGDAGYYLIIGSTEANPTTTGDSINERLVIDGTDQGIFEMEAEQTSSPTTDWECYQTMNVTYLGSGSHTIEMQHKVDSGDAGPMYSRRSRVSAIRLNDFLNFEISVSETYTTTSATSWTRRHHLTFTPASQEDYLFFMIGLLGGDASNGNAYNTFVDSRIGSTEYGYWEGGISDNSDRLTYFSMKNISLGTSSQTIETRYYGGASAGPDPGLGSVRIVGLEMPERDTNANTDYSTYQGAGSDYQNLNKIDITVEVDSYDPRGSVEKSNTKPDLELDVWDGSSWYNVGNFNLTKEYTGNGLDTSNYNFTLSVINSSILDVWKASANRDLRIRGINFDYYNVSHKDEINWTGVWVGLYNGSELRNLGSTNISGYLLMQVQTNISSQWTVIDTVINDTNTSTLRNLSSGGYLDLSQIWNSDPWNTNSQQTGWYRVYYALTDDEGTVLQNDDNSHINNTHEFQISLFDNISATPQTVGYGYNVTISADVLGGSVDTVFVNITYPDQTLGWKQMINISNTYRYNFSDTWQWGDYSYNIWVNDTSGGNSTSSAYDFYVRANATMSVYAVNDSYGPNEDVNLGGPSDWWNFSWHYRKQVNVTEPGVHDRLNWPVDVYINTSGNADNCTKEFRVIDDNGNEVPLKVYNETSSGANVVFLVNETKDQNRTYHVYYGNPSSTETTYNIFKDSCGIAEDSRSCVSIYYSRYNVSSGSGYGLDPDWNTTTEITPADDACAARNLPWNFSFFNQTILTTDTVLIEDNGFVNFNGSCVGNDFYPQMSVFKTTSMIAPIWSDWRCGRVTSNGLFENTFTNKTIWTWDCDAFGQESYTEMQAVLYITGDIMLRYGDVTGTEYRHGSLAGISNGENTNYFNNEHPLNENISTAFYQYSGAGNTSIGDEEEVPAQPSQISNTGSLDIKGYLIMRVQRYEGGSWVNFEAPTVNDPATPTERTINSSDSLRLDTIWNPAGWDTNLNVPGTYRINSTLVDPSGIFLRDDLGNIISAVGQFEIIGAYMELTNLTHENKYDYSVDEYETGDNISWINVTVTNRNATAVNASISLNVLDHSSSQVDWGPNETQYCGDIGVNESCEKRFDNQTNGYLIPLDATSGYYDFAWNVTMGSEVGETTYNNSLIFYVYHIPDNLSSLISPQKIYQNKSSLYNFTITNPWSKNLTSVNVSVNCPASLGFTCNCTLAGQEDQDYCYLENVTPSGYKTASFNISTNLTPAGDYHINATISYTNVGGEYHKWEEQQDKTLMVRIPGQFVEVTDYPTVITRGESGDLRGYVNNTLEIVMNDVWLNWTLPNGWTNSSGNLNEYNETLNPANTLWNNITAGLVISSQLGPQEVRLDSGCQEGFTDWDIVTVTIYANTSLTPDSSDSNPARNDTIQLNAYLKYDNSTGIYNQNVTFRDETTGQDIGWNLTDSSGFVILSYQISQTEVLGEHEINASYSGDGSIYSNPSWNTTNITVHDRPFMTDVSASPQTVGYGYNVTVSANVTDWDGVDEVRVYITPPSEGTSYYLMTNYTPDIYEYNFSNTWKKGQYSYYIWALDEAGKTNQSSTYYFYVGTNSTVKLKTENDTYGPDEYVNLTNITVTDYIPIRFDALVMNNGTKIDNPDSVEIGNVTKSVNETCDSEDIVHGTEVSGTHASTHEEGGSVRVINEVDTSSGGNFDYAIEVWYTFDTAANESDVSKIELITDAWSDETISIDRYNYDTPGWGDTGSDVSASENTKTVTICTSGCGAYIDNATGNIRIRYDDDLDTDTDQDSLSIDYHVIAVTTSVNKRYYIKFNLSEIPAGATIQEANLTFRVTGAQDANGTVYHANETFDSSTPTDIIYNDGPPSECSESNPIGNFSASTTGNKTINVTTSVIESYGASKSSISYFVNESGEDAYFEMDASQGSNPPVLKVVYTTKSQISNLGSTDIKGYLTMKVQRQDGESWQDVSGGLVVDNQSHNISSRSYLDLIQIWNPSAWNTNEEPAGTYRVYVYLADSSGTALKNDDDSDMEGYYQFSVTEPPSVIQIREIKIYDVTNASNKHTNTSILAGSGLNTTFDIYTGNVYRAEIVVWNNDTSESNWTIGSSDQIYHEELDSVWEINHTHDIWYANSTMNYSGGNWSSQIVEWNTSQEDMLVQVDQNVTFYYIFNITSMSADQYFVHFVVNNSLFTEEDYSTYNVIASEDVPPKLYNEIYGLTDYAVNRGDSLKAYARWDEEIKNATAEYNDTFSGLGNHTISSPYTNDWTNHTLDTNTSWLLGNHSLKIYSSDLNDNWNDTLPYLTFEVWGWSSVPSSSINPSTVVQGNPVTMFCSVVSDNTSDISGYSVAFYNSTEQLGVNQTNATGWARWTFVDNSLGYENITCNITDNTTMFYNASSDNQELQTLRTIETESPKYSQVTQNISVVHKGDAILYRAYWTDNVFVDYAWLSTNESGIFQNSSLASPIWIDDTDGWSDFEVTIPITMTPNILGWRIYANDTSSNENVTLVNTTEVWGWAEVSDSSLNPSIIYEGEWSIFSCRVIDSNGSALSGYNVSFYNSTNSLGINQTNTTGWAFWNYTDYTNGTDTLVCNITDYAGIMYNASANNNKTETLTTKEPGEDITPPYVIVYEINDMVVWKGDSLFIYAQWNESIGSSYTMYNDTSSQIVGYTTEVIGGDNWTNHTIETNSSWITGVHVAKINASDQAVPENWNNTLPYKTFEVWGRSKVEWTEPAGNHYRETIPLTCRVIDKDGGYGIEDYQIDFYDDDWVWINTANTNSTGYATVNWDAQTETVGVKTLRCLINDKPSAYYNTTGADDDASDQITLIGILNVSVDYPENESGFNVGDTVNLNSTTKDENDAGVTPDAANWTNTTNYIGSGENTTWTIPTGHSIGPELITVNVTKQYYDSSENNITIFVWGWADVNWTSPDDGMYQQNEDINLVCRVTDSNSSSGISNYPINFYRDGNFLSTNYTNSTGYANYTWNTDSFGGQITLSCNITDNSTLYYNASFIEDNTTIEIDITPPDVENETRWHSSNINYNESINITVDVSDSSLDKVWVRLGRPETGDYLNVSISNMTPNTYNLTSGEYSYEVGIWNATFFANDTAGNENNSHTTLNWTVWGWAEVNWTYPDDGEHSQGSTIPLTCLVMNSNTSASIQNYPVEFYVENSTDSISLGNDLTNSSGYATVNWDTTGYVEGYYYPKCNITDNSTLYYNASVSEDNTTINITAPAGKLIVVLNEPLDDTIVPRYRNFTINATVTCRDADCGTVQGRARYNSSGTEPNTDIPGSGTPFYTFDSNPQSCGSMSQDENCTLIWKVNSTGSLDSYYNIDVLFTSPSNDTTNSLIRIGLVLVLNVSTDSIDWGNRDPNLQGIAAPGNPYQVGLEENSNDAAGLYIKGTDMTGSTSTPIVVSNISWCKECSGYGTSSNMTYYYQEIQASPPSGVTYDTYFWLDTPPVYFGYYEGAVTIMANVSW